MAIAVAAGGRHSLVVTNDGQLLSSGINENGQLGRPTATSKTQSRKTEMKFWGHTSLAIHSGPSVSRDDYIGEKVIGEFNNFADPVFAPVPLPPSQKRGLCLSDASEHGFAPRNLNLWIACAAGSSHSIALRADGSVWTWGNNTFGQLGLGEDYEKDTNKCSDNYGKPFRAPIQTGPVGGRPIRPDVFSPREVVALRGLQVDYIAAGAAHSLFRAQSGSVQVCGQGGQGQLGVLHKELSVGDISDRATPEVIDALGKDEDV